MRKLLSKVLVLTAMTAIFLTATAAAAEIGSGVIDGDLGALGQAGQDAGVGGGGGAEVDLAAGDFPSE